MVSVSTRCVLSTSLTQPACCVHPDGTVAVLNAAWQELSGLPAGTLADLVCAEDRHTAQAHLDTGDRTYRQFECRLVSAAGTPRWFLLTLQDHEHGWLCTAADIHELKDREQALGRLTDRQKNMLDSTADCIKLLSPDGLLMNMNDAGCEALGVTGPEAIGREWLSLLPPDVRAAGRIALRNAADGACARFPGRSENGQSIRFWDNMLTPVLGPDGRPSSILVVSRDVTAERAARQELRDNQLRLSLAAHVGGLGVWDYDIDNDVMVCDDTWYQILGRDPARPIRSVAEFRPCIHPEDVDRATEIRDTATEMLATGDDYGITYRIVRPDGEVRWVRSAACMVDDTARGTKRVVGFIVDITAARRYEEELRDTNRQLEEAAAVLTVQAELDPLTGIANKRRLESELARMCAEATGPLSVAMIDVDHFKAYNDNYGHLHGDDALCRIATVLQNGVRAPGLVARFGGEEFVLALPDTADPSGILQRIAAAIDELAIPHIGSPCGRVTISCGCVTVGPDEIADPVSLLSACDAALYEAKKSGRNCLVLR